MVHQLLGSSRSLFFFYFYRKKLCGEGNFAQYIVPLKLLQDICAADIHHVLSQWEEGWEGERRRSSDVGWRSIFPWGYRWNRCTAPISMAFGSLKTSQVPRGPQWLLFFLPSLHSRALLLYLLSPHCTIFRAYFKNQKGRKEAKEKEMKGGRKKEREEMKTQPHLQNIRQDSTLPWRSGVTGEGWLQVTSESCPLPPGLLSSPILAGLLLEPYISLLLLFRALWPLTLTPNAGKIEPVQDSSEEKSLLLNRTEASLLFCWQLGIATLALLLVGRRDIHYHT